MPGSSARILSVLLLSLTSCVIESSNIHVRGRVLHADGAPAAGQSHPFCIVAHFELGDTRTCTEITTNERGEFRAVVHGQQRDINLGDFRYAVGELGSRNLMMESTLRSMLKIGALRYESETHHLWGQAQIQFQPAAWEVLRKQETDEEVESEVDPKLPPLPGPGEAWIEKENERF